MKEILSKINKLVTPSKSAEKHKSNIANEILKRVFKEIDGRLEIKGAEFEGVTSLFIFESISFIFLHPPPSDLRTWDLN